MSLQTDIRALKSMAEQYAIIDDKTGKDLCPIYPHGDRRRRPMGWMPTTDLHMLYQHGHLKRIRKGYAFTYAAERSLIEERWRLSADIHVSEGEEKTTYVPAAVQRKVRKRNGGYILRRLSKERGPNGQQFLNVHDLQAGELFQRDYARCFGTDNQGAQSLAHVNVDRTRVNVQEYRTIEQIDANQAFNAAKAVLGPGLEQAALIICGEGKSLEVLEREQHWVRGSGRMILKLALQRLAHHYGTYPGQPAQRIEAAL